MPRETVSPRSLALAALVGVVAFAGAAVGQNITKLENGPPTRYTITNVSSWPALGGAFFFGNTTPIGQAIGGPGLLITNNSFDQNGLAYLSSAIPKGSLFGGFDQDIGFLIDESRPTNGSQGDGVAWLFQPAGSPPSGVLANGQPAIQMYPPAGTAQIPGAVEVHVGTNGQASANEPQGSDFIAVYKNRDINYNNAACKLEVAKGTFVGKPVGVRTSYGYSAATNGTMLVWYRTPTRPYPIQPDLTCNNVPMPNVTGQDVFFSVMGSTAPAQANRHIMTNFGTDYCTWNFSGYSGADGGFCFCGPDFQPNAASNGCVPRQVGPTTSGLVPTSTVGPTGTATATATGSSPTSTASSTVVPVPPPSGLSGGQIAGIVVGSVAGAALLAAGAYAAAKRKQIPDETKLQPLPPPAPAGNAAALAGGAPGVPPAAGGASAMAAAPAGAAGAPSNIAPAVIGGVAGAAALGAGAAAIANKPAPAPAALTPPSNVTVPPAPATLTPPPNVTVPPVSGVSAAATAPAVSAPVVSVPAVSTPAVGGVSAAAAAPAGAPASSIAPAAIAGGVAAAGLAGGAAVAASSKDAKVAAPVVDVPAVASPTVSGGVGASATPSVNVPAVSPPALEAPTVAMPTVAAPTVSGGASISAPSVSAPSVPPPAVSGGVSASAGTASSSTNIGAPIIGGVAAAGAAIAVGTALKKDEASAQVASALPTVATPEVSGAFSLPKIEGVDLSGLEKALGDIKAKIPAADWDKLAAQFKGIGTPDFKMPDLSSIKASLPNVDFNGLESAVSGLKLPSVSGPDVGKIAAGVTAGVAGLSAAVAASTDKAGAEVKSVAADISADVKGFSLPKIDGVDLSGLEASLGDLKAKMPSVDFDKLTAQFKGIGTPDFKMPDMASVKAQFPSVDFNGLEAKLGDIKLPNIDVPSVDVKGGLDKAGLAITGAAAAVGASIGGAFDKAGASISDAVSDIKAAVPSVSLPKVEGVDLSGLEASLGEIKAKMPSADWDKLSAQFKGIGKPDFKMPDLDSLKASLPDIDFKGLEAKLGELKLPNIDLPKMDLPSVDVKGGLDKAGVAITGTAAAVGASIGGAFDKAGASISGAVSDIKTDMPSFSLPKIEGVDLSGIEASLGEIKAKLPSADWDNLTAQFKGIGTPDFEMPDLSSLKASLPDVDFKGLEAQLGELKLPNIDLPKMDLPSVDVKGGLDKAGVAIAGAAAAATASISGAFDKTEASISGTVSDIKADLPSISLPKIEGVDLSGLEASLGEIKAKMPSADWDKLSAQFKGIGTPDFKMPDLGSLKASLPDVDFKGLEAKLGELKLPNIDLPKMDLPSVDVKGGLDKAGVAIAGAAAAVGASVSGSLDKAGASISGTVSDIKADLPSFSLPKIDGLDLSGLEASLGDIKAKLPSADWDKLTAQFKGIGTPDFKMPDLGSIKAQFPSVDFKALEAKLGEIKLPNIDLPKVDVQGGLDKAGAAVAGVAVAATASVSGALDKVGASISGATADIKAALPSTSFSLPKIEGVDLSGLEKALGDIKAKIPSADWDKLTAQFKGIGTPDFKMPDFASIKASLPNVDLKSLETSLAGIKLPNVSLPQVSASVSAAVPVSVTATAAKVPEVAAATIAAATVAANTTSGNVSSAIPQNSPVAAVMSAVVPSGADVIPVASGFANVASVAKTPSTVADPSLPYQKYVGKELHATRAYVATKVSELTVAAGDVIKLEEINRDLWARGTNTKTGVSGWFPLTTFAAEQKAADPNADPSAPYQRYVGKNLTVTKPYSATKASELSVQKGDIININEINRDLWTYGTNVTTKQSGWFPLTSFSANR